MCHEPGALLVFPFQISCNLQLWVHDFPTAESTALKTNATVGSLSVGGAWVAYHTRPAPGQDVIQLRLLHPGTGEDSLVSAAPDGSPGNGPSRSAVLSPDGRFVVFSSRASNLVAGDNNQAADVFLVRLPATESNFRVLTVTRASSGAMTLIWPAESGRSYRVQSTASLGSPWSDLTVRVTVNGNQASATDTTGGTAPARFYRVVDAGP